MDDTQLRRLWRQHTSRNGSAEALLGLDDAASAQQRAAAVAAMAEDARLAELGRAVLALRDDATALAKELSQRQVGARQRRHLRPALGFALAASAALLAVLVLQRDEPGAELAPPAAAPASVFVASFEETASPTGGGRNGESPTRSNEPPGALFSAGFDS